jgi:hypothetical protein
VRVLEIEWNGYVDRNRIGRSVGLAATFGEDFRRRCGSSNRVGIKQASECRTRMRTNQTSRRRSVGRGFASESMRIHGEVPE